MSFFNHGLISHALSGTLPNSRPLDALGGISDDMSIAQGLLTKPRVPQRQASFTGPSLGTQFLEGIQVIGGPTALNEVGISRRATYSSTAWTCSSGDILSDREGLEDRSSFMQEYNSLAKKHGVRVMGVDGSEGIDNSVSADGKPRNWFSRNIFRRKSGAQNVIIPEKHLKHRRSISDISLRLKSRKDNLKNKSLRELVRLCGSSPLYLPAEYAAGTLAIPTCFRAAAQYLIQHAPVTKGVFRIPGTYHVVEELYNHYCPVDEDSEAISGTVRCPVLPNHIKFDVHDVASTFKRFLSGLPGGILGSLLLFDAFVAIQSQLQWETELAKAKQRRVSARLIALAISTLRSEHRRGLICAVFGVLCMVGHTAEGTSKDNGGPPTSDLMGYAALGIVFGPLLVGDLLDDWNVHLEKSYGGLVLLPVSPPKSKKQKRKAVQSTEQGILFCTQVDKIKIANGITEMLITHWREVARHMKALASLKSISKPRNSEFVALQGSISETYSLRKPPSWDDDKLSLRKDERSESPTPARDRRVGVSGPQQGDNLIVKRQRPHSRTKSNHTLLRSKSVRTLSPTAEEKTNPGWEKDQRSFLETKYGSNATGSSLREDNKKLSSASSSSDSSVHAIGLVCGRNTTCSKQQGDHTVSPKQGCVPNNPLNSSKALTAMVHPTNKVGLDRIHSRDELAVQPTYDSAKEPLGGGYSHCSNQVAALLQEKLPKSHQDNADSDLRGSTSQESQFTASLVVVGNCDEEPSTAAEKSSKIDSKHIKLRKSPRSRGKTSHQGDNPAKGYDLSPPKQVDLSVLIPPFNLLKEPSPLDTSGGTKSEIFCPIMQSEPPCTSGLQVAVSMQVLKPMLPKLMHNHNWRPPFKTITKDPLSRISYDEDTASLVTLAQTMVDNQLSKADVYAETPKRDDQETMPCALARLVEESGAHIGPVYNTLIHTNSAAAYPPGPSALKQWKEREVTSMKTDNSTKAVHEPNDHNGSMLLATKTPPTRCGGRQDVVGHGNSQGSVKALAARFEKPEAEMIFSSRGRAGAKSLSVDSPSYFNSHAKPGHAAQYRANSSSPAKSDRSGTWDRRPQLNFNRLPAVETKSKSNVDASPLAHQRIPRQQHLGKYRQLERGRRPFEGVHNSFAPHSAGGLKTCSVSSGYLEPPGAPVSKRQCSAYFNRPASGIDTRRKSMSINQSPQLTGWMGASQSPSISPNSETAHFAQRRRHFRDTPNKTQDRKPEASSRLPRSNSLLHAQVRALRAQIEKAEAEIRRLRRHLDTKSNFDIGTLSGKLREAEVETQIWKSRAEAAEKQVEIFSKVSSLSRGTSSPGRGTPRLSHNYENVNGSNADSHDENFAMADRTNRGLEGARSSFQLDRCERGGATVGETGDVVYGKDNIMCMEEIMVDGEYS